jgi:hypothetical protein
MLTGLFRDFSQSIKGHSGQYLKQQITIAFYP